MFYDLYQQMHLNVGEVVLNHSSFELLNWHKPFSSRKNEVRIDYQNWDNEPVFAGEEDFEIAQNKETHLLLIRIRFYRDVDVSDVYLLVEELKEKMVKRNFEIISTNDKDLGQVSMISAIEDVDAIDSEEAGGLIQLGVQFIIYDNHL